MFQRSAITISLFLVLFLISFTGCSLDLGISNANSDRYGVTDSPFASVDELDSITNSSGEYVFWRYARAFALMEFMRFRDDYNWRGAKLSERPVIIYGNDLTPKYYEFRVIMDNNLEIGAISCTARKKEGGPVAYVIPSPSDYSQVPETSKSAGTYHIIANNYPKTVVAGFLYNKSGITKGIDLKGAEVTIENDLFSYAMSHPEIYTNSNVTIEMAREYINSIISSNTNMWRQTESFESNLLIASTNDAGLEAMMAEQQSKASSFDGGYVIDGFTGLRGSYWWDVDYLMVDVLDWISTKYITDYSGPWCGPSIVALLLASYGNTSKVKYYNNDNDGYYNLCTNMGINNFNYGVCCGWNVSDGIKWGSDGNINYSYYLTAADSTIVAQLSGLDSWGRSKLSIDNNYPFIINRLGWIDGREGGVLGIGTGHYRIGVGYRDSSYWFNFSYTTWFLWFPIVHWLSFYVDSRYYLLLDGNGYEGESINRSIPGNRDYLINKNNAYCDNLFWEKKGTGDYMVLEFLFKK